MNTPVAPFPDERLKEVARRFHYPPTPDVTESVMKSLEGGNRPRARMRSAWLVAGLLVLALAVLFAVPGVRAEIVRFLQVGVVRIFPSDPTQTDEAPLSQIPTTATPAAFPPSTATPPADFTPYVPPYTVSISGLAGEMTLAEAQSRTPFPIRLPEYPAELGDPDLVFLQEDGPMIVLAWNDPNDLQKIRLSLHEIGPEGPLVSKIEPLVIQETQVNGSYAVWAQGPYLVQLSSGAYDLRRTVEGNTLIWEAERITYRLESNLSLEETIRIAESLK
ncbi:MAG: hypothetical protein JW963_18395 [Anaerolineales bacterium]|nr:hypothetical protein [Anaerolineales bacterium]